MNSLFKVNISTLERTIFDGQVSALCVPAESGYLGVLAHHAPLVSILTIGKITLRDAHGVPSTVRSTGSGFFEVRDNEAIVLLDSVDAQPFAAAAHPA